MPDRDELLVALALALPEVGTKTEYAVAALDAVEPMIRADEKAKHLSIPIVTRATIELATPKICDLLLDEVRAKVQALPQAKVAGVLYAIDDVVSRAEVLALLDGSNDA